MFQVATIWNGNRLHLIAAADITIFGHGDGFLFQFVVVYMTVGKSVYRAARVVILGDIPPHGLTIPKREIGVHIISDCVNKQESLRRDLDINNFLIYVRAGIIGDRISGCYILL